MLYFLFLQVSDSFRELGVWLDARLIIIIIILFLHQRDPVACGIDAIPVLNWESGCISTTGSDHVISVVGWGKDAGQGQYWIVRK